MSAGRYVPGGIVAVALVLLAAPLQPGTASGSAAPDPLGVALAAVRVDPRPPKITRSAHFVVSDERRHDLFLPRLYGAGGSGVGGIFIGLGTDQNYLMAAWARAERLILFDFDQVVVDLHRIYRVAFLHARDPETFVALWSPRRARRLLRLVRDDVGDVTPRRWRAIRKAFEQGRGPVYARLRKARRVYGRLGVPTFLDDPEQYRHLVRLFRAGRVFAVRGDLTGPHTMLDLAAALRAAGQTVRVLHLSNAEQYFDFGEGFRRNILALPMDAQSIVLRTIAKRDARSVDRYYNYFEQAGLDFQRWLRGGRLRNVWTLWRHRRRVGVRGHYTVGGPPPQPPPLQRPQR